MSIRKFIVLWLCAVVVWLVANYQFLGAQEPVRPGKSDNAVTDKKPPRRIRLKAVGTTETAAWAHHVTFSPDGTRVAIGQGNGGSL